MSSLDAWPQLNQDDKWIADVLEDTFANTSQTPEALRARAAELRDDAERTDIPGVRRASLQLAERYEQAAAARAPSP